MLFGTAQRTACLPFAAEPIAIASDSPAYFMLTVDTEAEFDWNEKPRRRLDLTAHNLEHQTPVLDLCAQVGVVPTFLFDTTCVADAEHMAPFVQAAQAETIRFGTHVHAWSAPPFDEALTDANSYAGNLSPALEAAKLARLTKEITERFGCAPQIHRAGRYGIGANTPDILARLGYRVDLSINAGYNFSCDGGPDFRAVGNAPLRCGPGGSILSIPTTGGRASRWRRGVVRLSPEGQDVATLCRAMRRWHDNGLRIFVLTYHSSSLLPGATVYGRTSDECRALVERLRRMIGFLSDTLRARPIDPLGYAAQIHK